MTGIVNYGAGNIYSVLTAFEKCGEKGFIIENLSDFSKADRIILPGVGAFADGIRSLRSSGLITGLYRSMNEGKPFLGICLGLQLLFSHSEEGNCDGFNLIRGKVKKFSFSSREIKVPHMGWSLVEVTEKGKELFRDIPDRTWFYFAHSYYAVPEETGTVAGKTHYGHEFASVVRMGSIVGVQFHPEKSGYYGLVFVKNFLEGKWLP